MVRWQGSAVCALVLSLRSAVADIDNLFPVLYTPNPVARHVAAVIPAGTPTVVQLYAVEEDGKTVEVMIYTLPTSGGLYETSENYRTYGTEPKYAPQPIYEYQLPYKISDALFRVVYVPPSDVFPPEGRWASFTYKAREPLSASLSEDGQVCLSSPDYALAASSYIGGTDSWSIEGNIHTSVPTWQAFGWGLLNRYVYGVDEVHYMDFDVTTDSGDKAKWYFVAPPGKFNLPEMVAAYGGKVRFTISSTYGDFQSLNSPLDFITIECATCDSGRGIRIVRMADNGLEWDGSERVVEVPLTTTDYWWRDPMNKALPFKPATECEIVAVLGGITKFKILGDFTKAGEGVAIDDVAVIGNAQQPAVPLACQQGCTCKHNSADRRITCCGSDSYDYLSMPI